LDPSFGSTWGRRRGRFELPKNADFAYHRYWQGETWFFGPRQRVLPLWLRGREFGGGPVLTATAALGG